MPHRIEIHAGNQWRVIAPAYSERGARCFYATACMAMPSASVRLTDAPGSVIEERVNPLLCPHCGQRTVFVAEGFDPFAVLLDDESWLPPEMSVFCVCPNAHRWSASGARIGGRVLHSITLKMRLVSEPEPDEFTQAALRGAL
jgi:hypothetical protein